MSKAEKEFVTVFEKALNEIYKVEVVDGGNVKIHFSNSIEGIVNLNDKTIELDYGHFQVLKHTFTQTEIDDDVKCLSGCCGKKKWRCC